MFKNKVFPCKRTGDRVKQQNRSMKDFTSILLILKRIKTTATLLQMCVGMPLLQIISFFCFGNNISVTSFTRVLDSILMK